VSDFFRDLAGQGNSSSTKNTQWWLDTAASAETKKGRGEALTPEEQVALANKDYWAKKAKDTGVEPTKTVSETTGVPDLTDKAAQARKMSQALSLVSGRGQRQSMINGEYDDSMLTGF
jgi:hypothetical protein